MSPSRPEPRSGLPAPYEDPWRRLAADLRAVLASLRLRLWELWRRNGDGDLPTPRFWPARLASLFWPLLLAALLALGASGALLASRQRPPATPPSPAAADRPAAWPSGAGHQAAPPAPEGAGAEAAGPAAAQGGLQIPPEASGLAEGAGPAAGPLPQAGPAAAPEAAAAAATPGAASAGSPAAGSREARPATSDAGSGTAVGEEAEVPPSGPGTGPDPLLRDLVGDPLPLWLEGLQAVPAEGLLRLRLGDGFAALSEAERHALAEGWLARAQRLGFERLELLGQADRLLARTARVGSGMILLDSPAGRR